MKNRTENNDDGWLDKLPKADFFKAPENYFDELPNELQSKIGLKPKKLFWRQGLWFRFAFPTLLIIIFTVYLFLPTKNNLDLKGLQAEDIEEYFNTSDEDLLSDLVLDNPFDESKLDLKISDSTFNEDLENYFEEEIEF